MITARTSGRCAADYGTHGYDLRTIRHGERLAERSGPFRLWIELAVIAHLIGRPTRPLPAHVEEQIADQRATVLTAAIAHGVDHAVAERSPAILDRIGPADLAAHVAGALRNHLWGTRSGCPSEPSWTATPFVGYLVLDDLTDFARHDTGRHPRTTEWETNLGVELPGDTAAEQLHHAQWSWATAHSRRVLDGVLFGADTPCWIERHLGTDRTAPDWRNKIGTTLTQLGADRMIIATLRHRPS